MPRELTDSLDSFDLKNRDLSLLFSLVAIDLDNLNKKRYDQLDENYYARISKAAKILKDKSQDFRMKKDNFEDVSFFWDIYGKEDGSNIENLKNLYVDRLCVLSEELLMAKNLSVEKIGELAGICVRLSEKAREYWNENNPNGFKKY